jgi:hypothetical protein
MIAAGTREVLHRSRRLTCREPRVVYNFRFAGGCHSNAEPSQFTLYRPNLASVTTYFGVSPRAETIERFYAIADRHGWVLGEAFERAIAALERIGPN